MSPALVEYMAANVYLCENGLLCIIVNSRAYVTCIGGICITLWQSMFIFVKMVYYIVHYCKQHALVEYA